ncbi:MAG: hypothetical protein IIZ47_01730 [Erysipelotrichaceae bacterium]|nr:hypothetical protein [Erysipelotrichaceae bacterium]
MKRAEIKMGLMMSLSMSFLLSLIGMLSSGAFTIPGFLTSVLISFCISTLITTLVPMRKISMDLARKLGIPQNTLKGRLFDTLVSDLLLTPLMTFVMVYLAYRQAVSHGARIPFEPMLLRSEIISFLAAYALIFFLTPVFLKIAFRGSGNEKQ